MAIRGLSLKEEKEYVCRADPAFDSGGDFSKMRRDGATIFTITNVPSGIMSRIADMTQVIETEAYSTKQRYITQPAQKNREAFKYGVLNMENLQDENDRPIPFETVQQYESGQVYLVVSDKTLDRVPTSILSEVGAEVIRINTLSETQAKNLEAPSSQSGASNTSDATSATTSTNSEEATTSDGLSQTSTEPT